MFTMKQSFECVNNNDQMINYHASEKGCHSKMFFVAWVKSWVQTRWLIDINQRKNKTQKRRNGNGIAEAEKRIEGEKK